MATTAKHLNVRETSILEHELEFLAQTNLVEKLRVMETPQGYFLLVRIKPLSKAEVREIAAWDRGDTIGKIERMHGEECCVTTRRNRTEPRLFADIARLNERLKTLAPKLNYEVVRAMPTRAKMRKD